MLFTDDSLSWLMIGLALVLLILALGLLHVVTRAQQQLRQQHMPHQGSVQRDMPLPPAPPERVWIRQDTWNGRIRHGTQLESEE